MLCSCALPPPAARCPLHAARSLPHSRCRLPGAGRPLTASSADRPLRAPILCPVLPALPQMSLAAQNIILNVIGGQFVERWPELEENLFFNGRELTYDGRVNLATFLYGNTRCVQLVYEAMLPLVGPDPRARDHAKRFLHDLNSGRYDNALHYFDVHAADWLYLNGQLNVRRRPACPFVRLLNAWEAESARMWAQERRWPTLAEQRAFFSA